MRVTALPARDVENSRSDRQTQDFLQPRDLDPVAPQVEDRLVLPQVMGVECRLPPLRGFLQKKTGSRYAPKTDSIAARISYSVQ